MDKLTLEHLAPYLPYGLTGVEYQGAPIHKLVGFEDRYSTIVPIWRNIDDKSKSRIDCMPLLIPRSSLSETDYKNLGINPKWCGLVDWIDNPHSMTVWEFKYLLKMKIDVFCLIDKGLAIDINSIE